MFSVTGADINSATVVDMLRISSRASSGALQEQQQPMPDRWLEKAYVCTALQSLDGASERQKALEGVAAWRERFAEAKWKPVIARIKKVAEEDQLRVLDRKQPPVTSAERPSAPTRRLRINTAAAAALPAPYTPRARWDVLSAGPVTPLSSTPKGNAFASGGFWERLTPQSATSISATPSTAIPPRPWSPIVPRDRESRAVYDEVKREVDKMALKICASRLSIHSSLSENGLVHPSMVKPKDELHGTEFTLQSKQIRLKSAIDPELPEKIDRLAEEATAAIRQHAIKDAASLLDIDSWLQVDEKTLEMTTVLDAQRGLLHMNRDRRKSTELKLSEKALRMAWAVKILDDTERMVANRGDDSSTTSDDDQGYDYSSFLRSLRREVSSTSDVASILEEQGCGDIGSLRSSGTPAHATDRTTSREASLSVQSSSMSSKKASHSSLALQSQETSLSHSDTPTPLPRNSLASRPQEASLSIAEPATPLQRSTRTARQTLSISTTVTQGKDDDEQHDIPSPQLSPEQKGFRRRGPSFTDLTNWAHELKKMEDHRAEMPRVEGGGGAGAEDASDKSGGQEVHPLLRTAQHARYGSLASAGSWKYEDAAKRESQAGMPSSDSEAPGGQKMRRGPSSSSPTPPSTKSLTRSASFYERHHLTGPIPLPPSLSSSYAPQAAAVSPEPSRASTLDEEENWMNKLTRLERMELQNRPTGGVARRLREKHAWGKELKHMESKEKIRQLRERQKEDS